MNFAAYVFTVAVAACAVGFTLRGFAPAPVGSLENLAEKGGVFHKPHPMERRDLLPLGIICLVYTIVAFIGLGSGKAPESYYHFQGADNSVTLELSENREAGEILWFSAITHGNYLVELSPDGESWTEQGIWEQDSSQQLKWHTETPALDGFRFLRITETSGSCYLGEVAVRDKNGELIPFLGETALTDEQDTVPEHISYMNSSYFDEIYHPRTALEYLMGEPIYEVSHPPLGKGIISLGVRLFGMNPFGWRFMGVICGILMLPLMYVFLKNLFGRTAVAACATTVFAFDFMHFVQTRIATIDSYTTFFVLLMFWLMYRWFTQPLDAPAGRTAPWLFAAGAAFGVGAACKWSVIYGGAGLAVIWLIRVVMLFRYKGRRAFLPVLGLIGQSIVFFILIPCAVYYLSYQPYGAVKDAGLFSREYLDIVLDNQKYMFNYHSKLDATHPYQSTWWQWVLDVRPILYYLEYIDDSTKSAFAAFGNPLFWWAGLGCLISLAVTVIRRRDAVGLLILIGWLSELLPWVGISRCAFIYHYFPCTVFLALAVGWQMEGMCRAREAQLCRLSPEGETIAVRRCDGTIFVFTGLCILMFVLFYPVLTGIPFSRAYTNGLLRWFGGQYPF
ncbi:MAG: phospholipid carrier-dependent glycosyltransferase [Clostridiales bacterium]|nr:phospholipid carrier-dependent glycosyltransferase [Clostridiales bacterium]